MMQVCKLMGLYDFFIEEPVCDLNSAAQCDVMIKILQRKFEIDRRIRKNASNQDVFVLTPFVYHFSLRKYRLVCFGWPVFASQHIKLIENPLMTHNSKTG